MTASSSCATRAVRVGRPDPVARRRPRRSSRASSSRCSARTASASRRWSRRSSGCSRSTAGTHHGARRRARRAATSDIGYLPQRRSFDADLRVRGVDVVRLGLDGDRWGLPLPGARRWSARATADEARVHEVIELVGAQALRRPADRQLSGGEQQRLLIAQALASRPGAAAARRAAGQPRPAQPGAVAALIVADLPRRGRDGADGRPRREPDPRLPRPRRLPRGGRRRCRDTRRGHHRPRR